jgi:hypothetical protein
LDTDIGAFIESSTVSSAEILMARLIINNDAVSGETFLPGHIFVFGGFALRANSTGQLEQIDSYAPGHQIRFGSLNYIADIRGDLIFEGFSASTAAPHLYEGGPSDSLSDSVQGSTIVPARALDPEQTTLSEDGSMNPTGPSPTTELPAGDPEVTILSAGLESNRALPVIGKPDSPPDVNSELLRPASIEHGRAVISGPISAGSQSPV